MEDWNWKPRFDLDLAQRSLTIIAFSWIFRLVIQNSILNWIGLSWIAEVPLDLFTVVLLIGAFCKSSIQYSPNGKAVLITGCDTGFGFQLASWLHKLGFVVYAGCLFENGEGAKDLRKQGIDVLQLDITKEEEWDTVIAHIKEKSRNLWGIVNNAGWSTFGDIEFVPMKTYRKITEINFFGLILAIQKATPLVRASKGRIVTITSGIVRGVAPSRSAYCGTKMGGVGILECLRYEMKRFGVQVSMIEPGNYLAGTALFNQKIVNDQAEAMWNQMSDEVKSAYGREYFQMRADMMAVYQKNSISDLTPVLESYTNALLDVWPQVRYQPMTLFWKIRAFVSTHLPESLFEWYYL